MHHDYDFKPGDLLDLPSSVEDAFADQEWVAYPHNMTSPPMPFDQSHPIKLPKCNRADFGLWHVAPVFSNGWVLMGEMDKFVPISEQRIRSMSVDDTSVTIVLRGAAFEEVTIAFWKPSSTATSDRAPGEVVKYKCDLATMGVSTLTVPAGSCA